MGSDYRTAREAGSNLPRRTGTGSASHGDAGVAPVADTHDASRDAVSGHPDGAPVFTGPLPACTASMSGSRTLLACAGCFQSGYGACSTGAADCQFCGACVMACAPDDYAVYGDGHESGPPAGCQEPLPVMEHFLLYKDDSAEGPPVVYCCPCG